MNHLPCASLHMLDDQGSVPTGRRCPPPGEGPGRLSRQGVQPRTHLLLSPQTGGIRGQWASGSGHRIREYQGPGGIRGHQRSGASDQGVSGVGVSGVQGHQGLGASGVWWHQWSGIIRGQQAPGVQGHQGSGGIRGWGHQGSGGIRGWWHQWSGSIRGQQASGSRSCHHSRGCLRGRDTLLPRALARPPAQPTAGGPALGVG